MSRRTIWWLLAAVIVLGVVLRAYELVARSIWFDEAFTWRLLQFSWVEMIERAVRDVHPPLYYLIIKAWSWVFGTSLQSLRAFSVTFSALSIGAAYMVATYAWGQRRAGLLAAALVAFSGWQIVFAREARMYSLGVFFALLSTGALLKAIRTRQLRWWGVYAVLAAAFAYTHYFAFFTIAAQAVFVVGVLFVQTRGRIGEMMHSRVLGGGLLAAVVAVGLYLPWLPVMLNQNQQVQDAYWVPVMTRWSIPDSFYRFLLPTGQAIERSGTQLVTALLPLAAMVAVWLVLLLARPARHRDADWLIALSGSVPFLIAAGISALGQSVYQDRFLLFAQVMLLVAIAGAVARLPWARVQLGLGALLIIGFGVLHVQYLQELTIDQTQGARSAVAYVAAAAAPDDPVLVTSSFIFFTIDHYLTEEHDRPGAARLLVDTADTLMHFAGGPIITEQDLITVSKFERLPLKELWLVETTGFGGGERTVPPVWRRVETRSFDELFDYQGEIITNQYSRELP